MNKLKIKKGTLLLAQPFMADPNFKRSVVLITDHHKTDGTVGYALDRLAGTRINDLINNFPDIDSPLFIGGPVGKDTLHYIHDVGHILDDSIKVVEGVYWGGDYEKLKFLIKNQLIKPHNIKFFIGYSGWTAGQLADEVEYGSWMLSDMDPNYAFDNNPKELWKKITRDKGGRYTVISELPNSNHLN